METSGGIEIRPARLGDAEAVAVIWRQGWIDGHAGNVPDELVAIRRAESFTARAEARVAETTVAVVDGKVTGFVMVVDDVLDQCYVARDSRGTGVASALLAAAERQIRDAGHAKASLVVAVGNARAIRFYERHGWTDTGVSDHGAPLEGGGVITVRAHRYVKRFDA